MTLETQKRAAAAEAVKLVESGMRLGLGTGSTARHFIELLGERVAAGLDVLCVATSLGTAEQARACSIPLTTLDEVPELDLTVDGADELDDSLTLIKGGGGALLREKIVAAASRKMVVIADASKHVRQLGRFPLPVEVNAFGMEATRRMVEAACAAAGCPGPARLRRMADGAAFVTDSGHRILDCALGAIPDAPRLGAALNAVPGVVEHGIFIGLCRLAILASQDGIALLDRKA
jgi:ribose 5-phosphate isomerase A